MKETRKYMTKTEKKVSGRERLYTQGQYESTMKFSEIQLELIQ